MKVILLFVLLGLYQASGNEVDDVGSVAGGTGSVPGNDKYGGTSGDDAKGGTSGGVKDNDKGGNKGCPAPPKPVTEKYICRTSKVSYWNSDNCLSRALKESSQFVNDVSQFLCEYLTLKEGGNSENFVKAAKSFTFAVDCIGCQLDKLLGTGITIETLLHEITETTGKVGTQVEKLVSALEIAKPVAKTLCLLVGKTLQSKCMKEALGKTAPAIVQDLGTEWCQDTKNTKKIAKNAAKLMKETACVGDELLGTEKSLEEILESLDGLIIPVVGTILDITKQIPLISDLLCGVLGDFKEGGLLNSLLNGISGRGNGGLLGSLLRPIGS